MAKKSALPMLLVAGAAAVVLTKGKKKKKAAAKPAVPAEPKGKEKVVASGSVERVFSPKSPKEGMGMPYEWRVRKSNGDYVAEVGQKSERTLKVPKWEKVGTADNMEDAKELAFSYIDKQPGFEYASSVIASARNPEFDMIVREGEYTEVTGEEGLAGTKKDTIEGFIGEYRLKGQKEWVQAATGQDPNRVRILTLEAGTLAADALGAGGDEYPEHMRVWMAVCKGDVAMLDMGTTIGVHPYCPTATPGQTVTSGANATGERIWRIQKTANPSAPYVVQNNLTGDWEHVDSDIALPDAIIKGHNSVV